MTARNLIRTRTGRNSRGFTLVELMVVILIIGMLAGVVMFSTGGATDDAKLGIARQDVNKLGQAVEMFMSKADMYQLENRMPQDLQELIDGPQSYEGKWEPILSDRQVPKDPWGREYEYKIVDEEAQHFQIICYGKDGRPGGEPPYNKDIVYPKDSEDQ